MKGLQGSSAILKTQASVTFPGWGVVHCLLAGPGPPCPFPDCLGTDFSPLSGAVLSLSALLGARPHCCLLLSYLRRKMRKEAVGFSHRDCCPGGHPMHGGSEYTLCHGSCDLPAAMEWYSPLTV